MNNKVIPGRVFLDIINDRLIRRVFGFQSTEICIDFNIQNNTLITKLQDSIKVKQFKQGRKMKTSMFASRREYALGRITSFQLLTIVNALNNLESLRTKATLKPGELIHRLHMHGKNVAIVVISKEEQARLDNPKTSSTISQ